MRVRDWLSSQPNKIKMGAWIKEHRLKNRPKRIALIREAKNKPCMDCGVSYPHYVMDFDHKTDKKFLIGRQVHSTTAVSKILEEIAKCDIVCSNCHRERTHGKH